MALHDKRAPDEPFLESLELIKQAADDERNFVKKAAIWALRGIGGRNPALNAAALGLARQLAESEDPTGRSTGKTVIRELASAASTKRLRH